MALRKDLVVYQANDETLDIAVTGEESGDAQDLTAKTLHLLIKVSQLTADTDPSTITLSSSGSLPAITINADPATGLAVAKIPFTDLGTAAKLWWRLDVVEDHKTVFYGEFSVQAL